MHKQGLRASAYEVQCRTGPPNADTEAKGQRKPQKAMLRWRQSSQSPGSKAVSASGDADHKRALQYSQQTCFLHSLQDSLSCSCFLKELDFLMKVR